MKKKNDGGGAAAIAAGGGGGGKAARRCVRSKRYPQTSAYNMLHVHDIE
jgi:hypothetical protein